MTGDASQKDLPTETRYRDWMWLSKSFSNIDDIAILSALTSKDVVRHPLVQQIVQAYDDYEKKQKPARRTTRRSEEKKK